GDKVNGPAAALLTAEDAGRPRNPSVASRSGGELQRRGGLLCRRRPAPPDLPRRRWGTTVHQPFTLSPPHPVTPCLRLVSTRAPGPPFCSTPCHPTRQCCKCRARHG